MYDKRYKGRSLVAQLVAQRAAVFIGIVRNQTTLDHLIRMCCSASMVCHGSIMPRGFWVGAFTVPRQHARTEGAIVVLISQSGMYETEHLITVGSHERCKLR